MLVRVFEIPRNMRVGYLFQGGVPVALNIVDWFRDDALWDNPLTGITRVKSREVFEKEIKAFIQNKQYFTTNSSYLILHPEFSFTINYQAD